MTALALNDASHLLERLLAFGGWRGSQAAIREAMPHMSAHLSASDMLRSLDNLDVQHTDILCKESEITDRECPALVYTRDGRCYVAHSVVDGRIQAFLGDADEPVSILPSQAKCLVARIDRYARQGTDRAVLTVGEIFGSLGAMLPWLLVASFLVNVLGLLAPLLVLAIYDRVIPSGSVAFLVSIAGAVAIVLAADFCLRAARTRALAHVGRLGEQRLSTALFRKLMGLPLQQLQKSGTDQQLTRFRQFESLREAFTGQLIATLMDLPFALIFLALLFYLSPPIGALILGAIVFFVVLCVVAQPRQDKLQRAEADATAATRAFLVDAVQHQRVIADLGMKSVWQDRHAGLVEAAEAATREARQFQSSVQSLAQTGASLVTTLAMVISAFAAMQGTLSFGAFIAVIALVSKVMAPFQSLQSNLPQFVSFLKSRTQADRVLALSEEMELGLAHSDQKSLGGAVAFAGVTYRPDLTNPPVLTQASFRSKAGELVLIMGSDVAGRTAVLDMIDGLVLPLSGTVEHDDIDIRQIARDELRRSISYDSFGAALFYGTVRQNFLLAAPTVSEDAMQDALGAAGIAADIATLPDGLDTRLNETMLGALSPEILRALGLARSIARHAPIHLFSEPTTDLGPEKRALFRHWLAQQKGQRTIFVASADRALLDLADRYIFLDAGRIVVNDTGKTGLKKIKAALQNNGG